MDMKGFFLFAVIVFVLFGLYMRTSASDYERRSSSTTARPAGRTVVLETEKGPIRILLFEYDMPATTKNFIRLVGDGFYHNMTFHRVVPGFVIQTGDPTGTGLGGSGDTIPLEVNYKHRNVRGSVGMARGGDRDSASSQFYILVGDSPHLDGGYAVFGEVVGGMGVVGNITAGDRLISAGFG